MPQFRVLDLPGRDQFDLKVSSEGVIGRDDGADFKLEHPTVSRKHAKLHLNAGKVVVVDLGSANGTRVNGTKIEGPTTLKEGDSVQFGKVNTLFFSANAPTAMAPVTARPEPVATESHPTADPTQPPAVPLERFENLLAALLEILAKPKSLTLRSQDVGQVFAQLIPSLKQVGLLDPCGKLIGGIRGGRMLNPSFYEAISGAVGAHNGTLVLEGPVLAGLCSQLNFRGQIPTNIVCLPLDSALLPDVVLYLEADGPFFRGEFADTIRLGAKLLGPLLDRAPDDYRYNLTGEDFRLAERVQKRMLAGIPSNLDGLSIATQSVPHYAIGGDFIVAATVGKKEHAFLLGDVSGKGVSASLVASQIMCAARLLLKDCKGPGDFLVALNDAIEPYLEPGVFATAAVVYINADKGSCRLTLAGHNPPVIRTKSGKVLEFGFDPGAPLGSVSKLEVREQRMMLAVGDSIILNSDGLEEAEKPVANKNFVSKLSTGTTELFGNERRNEVISRTPGAQNIAIALREAVFSFCDGERSSDDLSVLVIERLS